VSVILLYETPSGVLSALEFDAVTAEDHTVAADATEHTVETGANITDHVRTKLAEFTMQGVITNTPLNETTIGTSPGALVLGQATLALQGATSRQDTTASVTGGVASPFRPNGFPRPSSAPVATRGVRTTQLTNVSGSSLQATQRVDRVLHVYRTLKALCEGGVRLDVSTYLRVYEDMIITSLSAPRDGKDAITFSISFRELRTADSKTAVVRKRKPKEKRAEPKKEDGAKPKGWALEPEKMPRESLQRMLQNLALGEGLEED